MNFAVLLLLRLNGTQNVICIFLRKIKCACLIGMYVCTLQTDFNFSFPLVVLYLKKI